MPIYLLFKVFNGFIPYKSEKQKVTPKFTIPNTALQIWRVDQS